MTWNNLDDPNWDPQKTLDAGTRARGHHLQRLLISFLRLNTFLTG